MKRLLSLLLCAALVISLAACGGSGGRKGKKSDQDELDGEYYDAGNVKVFVPEGWKAFPVADVFAEEDNAVDPDALTVIKGGENEFDMFTKPYIRVDFYGEDTEFMGGLREFYDDTRDLEPLELGTHLWQGFTTTDYGGVMAVLWSLEDPLQFQVSIQLEVEGGGKISLEDEDVQLILESIAASDGTVGGVAQEPTGSDAVTQQWDGEWYGWWCILEAGGEYSDFKDIAWDAYADMEVIENNEGIVRMWDTETTRQDPLLTATAVFGEDTMSLMEGTFFYCDEWLDDGLYNYAMEVPADIWTADRNLSSVSHFADMIELTGTYQDPYDEENYFVFYIYLRPWGAEWDDVESGDTSGCIYSDMMPLYYYEWYLPLLEQGCTDLPDSFEAGKEMLK